MSIHTYGRYGVTPPPAGIPDHEVRAWNDNAACSKPRPTPEQAASTREAALIRGERVYDAANAASLWGIIDKPPPNSGDGPYRSGGDFGEEAISLAKRGRDIARKAIDMSPAATHYQRSSYTRAEGRVHGAGCSMGPIHPGYYDAIAAYQRIWIGIQPNLNEQMAL